MLPYLALIFLPIIFLFIAFYKRQEKMFLTIGFNQETKTGNLLIPAFFVIYFVLLVLRHESVGIDLGNYKRHFETIAYLDFRQAVSREGDILYTILNWLVAQYTRDFRIFLVLVAFIVLFPIANFYSEDREFGFLKIIIFMNMPNFIMIFSGLRQAIAFSLGVIAYKFIREKKLIWFLIIAFAAWGFHHSGFIVFFLYPLYHATFKRKHLWVVVPAIALVYVFNERIFRTVTEILYSLFGEDYSADITDTGAYAMLILFVLFAVFSYILPDEKLMDKEVLGLRNFLLAAIIVQCFVPLNPLAMRINYYFLIFVPVLIPKIIKCSKPALKQVAYLSSWVFSIYFLVYYIDKLYTACSTGISTLKTYPYMFYWQ